jgi:peptide/nickel transport system substrate-binding protein
VSTALAIALVTSACGGSGSPANDAPAEITVASFGEYPTVDASFAFAATRGQVQRQVMEPLLDRDGKDPSVLVPVLATSWTRVDPQTLRFQLRQDVKFQDGSDFNAEVAAFAINRLFAKENNFGIRQVMGPQITANVVDDHTVDVVTAGADPILEQRMTSALIQSKQQFDTGGQAAWEQKSIGTGPYVMDSWERGRQFILTKNNDWWAGADKLKIDKVIWLQRPDDESRLAAVQSGEAQLADRLAVDSCLQALDDRCISAPSNAFSFLRPDQTSSPVLKDARIREAIALAIDKDTIAKQLYANAPVSPTIIADYMVGYPHGLAPYPFDPAKAVELVNQAAADGVPTSTPIRIVAEPTRLRSIQNLTDIIRDALKVLPLNITVEIEDQQAFLKEFLGTPPEGRSLITLHEHANQVFDASGTYGSYARCGGPNSAFCDPAIDEDAKTAAAAGGPERDTAYQAVMTKLYDAYAWIPLFQTELRHGVGENLQWTPRADGFFYVKDMGLAST